MLRSNRKGNALIFVFSFLLVLSAAGFATLKWSFGQQGVDQNRSKKINAQYAAELGMDSIKSRVAQTLAFFSELQRQDRDSAEQAFEDYKAEDLVSLTNEFDLEESLIDWVNDEGVITDRPTRGASYSFFVRCIPDERITDVAMRESGSADGCPEGDRASWQLNNWLSAPKRIEIIVTGRFEEAQYTIREVFELRPVFLSDFAFALGNVGQNFRIFGGQRFGRIHFDSTGGGGANAPVINIDSALQSAIFLRPFTTAGIRVDAIDVIEGVPNSSYFAGSDSNPIIFAEGYSTSSPQLELQKKVRNMVSSIPTAPGGGVVTLDSSFADCNAVNIKPEGETVTLEGRNCPGGAPPTQSIGLKDATGLRPQALHDANKDFYVQAGSIDGKIGFYTERNIIFEGAVTYETASGNTDAFVPYLVKDPTIGEIKNPLSVAPADKRLPALKDNNQAFAVWAASQNIVIDPTKARPLKKDSSTDNGIYYVHADPEEEPVDPEPVLSEPEYDYGTRIVEFPDGSTGPYHGLKDQAAMYESNQKDRDHFDRTFVIDGKIQAGETFRLEVVDPAKGPKDAGEGAHAFDHIKLQRNLGPAMFRGGLIVGGTATPLKGLMETNLRNHDVVTGFNNVFSVFDGRQGFQDIPGQQGTISGQYEWVTIISEIDRARSVKDRLNN